MASELLAQPLREYLDDLVPDRSKEMQRMEAYAQETDFL